MCPAARQQLFILLLERFFFSALLLLISFNDKAKMISGTIKPTTAIITNPMAS